MSKEKKEKSAGFWFLSFWSLLLPLLLLLWLPSDIIVDLRSIFWRKLKSSFTPYASRIFKFMPILVMMSTTATPHSTGFNDYDELNCRTKYEKQ